LLELSDRERTAFRQDLSIGVDDPVALYCGRMYAAKRLGFLISAAERVREAIPSFQLILAGGWPDEKIAKEAARRLSYVHFLGPVFGEKKFKLFAISDIFVIPGMVGLNVVDAFHHVVPPVVTSYPHHSPEFAYLRHGENGLISSDDVQAFSEAIIRLARDESLRSHLIAGCRRSAEEITLEEMIARFGTGLMSALGMTPMRGN
ncbi:MAG TPA: glycosyltransferase family 4 protein, partial [Sinorhizobium sp.]|nr:glycosyltransferase family 4 protein [Sinorhizobium sp.]